MIYNVNGDEATGYNLNGQSASNLYDINGNLIAEEEPQPQDYSNYTISDFLYSGGSQGCDVYGKTLFYWIPQSTLVLRNVEAGNQLARISTELDTHGNDISFTDEFYDSADLYPLLLVDSYLLRIHQGVADLMYSFVLPLRPYGTGFNGKILYSIGYTANTYYYSEGNKLRISTLDLNDMIDNGDGTYTPTVINSVDRDWLECVQGADYHDGYLWVICGLAGGSNKYIYALDTQTGEIVHTIVIPTSEEMEGMCWVYNATDKWHIIFGTLNTGYRKITFN